MADESVGGSVADVLLFGYNPSMGASVRPPACLGGIRMVAGVMAKKKPGPKPDPSRTRDAVTMVRSTVAWKAAVDRMAEFDRAPSVSDLIDRAIAAYARTIGFPEPIPKR